MSDSKPQSFTLRQRVQAYVIGAAGWILVWVIGATLRYKVEGWRNFQQFDERSQPIIYSCWHNQIFSATYFWRFRDIRVITSRHFDGECIAKVLKGFGYVATRGSSSRGGVRALQELRKSLVAGDPAGFTVDGPRGPVYKVKPGPVWLSRKTGVPIIPFHMEPRQFWCLSSWDQFRIPKPFSMVLVKIGRPLTVSAEDEEGQWVQRYQEEMDRIRSYAEQYWAGIA